MLNAAGKRSRNEQNTSTGQHIFVTSCVHKHKRYFIVYGYHVNEYIFRSVYILMKNILTNLNLTFVRNNCY